jgi:hypothetical protein
MPILARLKKSKEHFLVACATQPVYIFISVAKAGKGDRKMRKIVGLIAFTALVVIALSCASDIVLEEEFSLKGLYTGKYIVITNYGSTNEVKQEQNIKWKFTDIAFRMEIDLENPLPQCFCIVSGTYTLENIIVLTITTSQPPGDFDGVSCTACNSDLDPVGSFTLLQPNDSLTLTYSSQQGDTLKQVLLISSTQ